MWYTVLIHYWYNAKIYICKILLKNPPLIALSLWGAVSYEAEKWWMKLWLWSWKSSPDEIWLCLPRLLHCRCSEHNIFMVISWQMEPRMWNCRNSEECWFFHRNCSIATSDTLLAVLHICQPQQNKVVADGPNINHVRSTTEWEVSELVPALHCTWWQWWWWCGIKAAAAAWPPLVHTSHRTHEAQQGDNT